MGDLFWNKVAAVIISMILLVLLIGVVGDVVFSEDDYGDEQAGLAYPIDLAEVLGGSTTSAPVEEDVPDLGTLLAVADVSAGERLFRRCVSCHNAAPGAGNLQGPNMWDVVGRDIGVYPGFGYSSIMADWPGDWTYENLDAFIASPRGYMNGTAMAFAGIRDEADRANLLAYLQTLSDNPVPFPSPAAIEDESIDTLTDTTTISAEGSDINAAVTEAVENTEEQLEALDEAQADGGVEEIPQEEGGEETPQDEGGN